MLNSCLPEGKAVPAPLEAPVKYVKYLCCVQMYQNGEGKTYSVEIFLFIMQFGSLNRLTAG
jgi:hypothetical protein